MSEINNSYYQIQSQLPQNNHSDSSNSVAEENLEFPILILTQHCDSHTFNERRILLSDTIKVGRSVARARPSDVNGIFDCKVLSRNHAIIWYENSKVLLKDTKSSNGTYVNNQLLSKGSEESIPREIYSGDIVQFGVEVVENTTTHGCIIAQVTITLPDGSELRKHNDMMGIPSGNIPMSNYYEEQIYQLAQYIQEAAHREQTLEKKLKSLSQLINDTQEASDNSWKVILNQDQLLEKLEMLQQQVDVYTAAAAVGVGSKSFENGDLVLNAVEQVVDRHRLERENKEILYELENEKEAALRHTVELESALSNSEIEVSELRGALEEISQRHEEAMIKLNEIEILSRQLESEAELRGKVENQCELLRQQLQENVMMNKKREDEEDKFICSNMIIQQLESIVNIGAQLDQSDNQLSTLLDSTNCQLKKHLINIHQHIIVGNQCISRLGNELDRLEIIRSHDNVTDNDGGDDGSGEMRRRSSEDVKSILDEMHKYNNDVYKELAELPALLLQYLQPKEGADVMEKKKDIEQENLEVQTDRIDVSNSSVQVDPELADEVIQTDTVIEDVDATESRDTKLKDNIENLNKQIEKSQELLEYEKHKVETLQAQLLDIQANSVWQQVFIDDVKLQLSKFTDDNNQLQQTNDNLNKQIHDITDELVHSKDQLNNSVSNTKLLEECNQLRERVGEIEKEMELKRVEYDRLYQEYDAVVNKKQESLSQLQQTSTPTTNHGDIIEEQAQEIARLHHQLDIQNSNLLTRSRRISALAVLPLVILLFGIMMTLLSVIARPWLPLVTVTNDKNSINNNIN